MNRGSGSSDARWRSTRNGTPPVARQAASRPAFARCESELTARPAAERALSSDGAGPSTCNAAKAGGDAAYSGCTRSRFPEAIGGRRGRSHRRAGADRRHAAGAGRAERARPAIAAPPASIAAPAAAPTVPIAAPAPSCGAPETRPEAMPGPKMPSPNSESAASTSDMAWPRFGSCPCSAVMNSAKKLEPMPTMTASTITLMPEEMTLPSTRSARKRGPVPEREGHQHEAGQRRQLELEDGDEELHREDEEGDDDDQPGDQQHGDRQEVVEEARRSRAARRPDGAAARPRRSRSPASLPGFSRSSAREAAGGRFKPESGERAEDDVGERAKLFRMNAKAPT